MRRKRPLERNTEVFRDTRLVVIASEDRYAVRQYFEFFRSRRIQFRFLETLDSKSAPEHVVERLENFLDEFDISEDDQLWWVADTDHWLDANHIKGFMKALRACRDKGIRVAISYPCFELWLLLHFSEFPEDRSLNCDELGARIRSLVGAYNKTKVYKLPISNEAVMHAIARSKAEFDSAGAVPDRMATGVHLIIDELISMKLVTIDEA